ncbi:hypothetical protein NHX12_033166 [Muraenolepis orangiensis]|uniref:Uncharacterized protein n=1 Tax=Muraenolepis orangiensis TaxID=630683 RepID=A0A9Q0IIG4_9TELE|nr:hypothetical protein NHX12_033166 [Muraenolepis orangiensis]
MPIITNLDFLLLLVGPRGGVACARVAFFLYRTASVASVAYISCYLCATGYVRGALLLGYTSGHCAGPAAVHLCRVVVPRGVPGRGPGGGALPALALEKSVGAGGYRGPRLAADCTMCFYSAAVVFLCVWMAVWKQPWHNFFAYNGVAEAVGTLSEVGFTRMESKPTIREMERQVCSTPLLGGTRCVRRKQVRVHDGGLPEDVRRRVASADTTAPMMQQPGDDDNSPNG